MLKKSSKHKRDSEGKWWYHFGKKKPTRTRSLRKKCEQCGAEFLTRANTKYRFCSSKCGGIALGGHRDQKGEKSHCWRGGRSIIRGGYVEVYAPEHPYARGKKYVREHRLVMEKMLGRYLEPYEQVHHRNGIKDDNRPENLELISLRVHLGKVECPHCHKTFSIK